MEQTGLKNFTNLISHDWNVGVEPNTFHNCPVGIGMFWLDFSHILSRPPYVYRHFIIQIILDAEILKN